MDTSTSTAFYAQRTPSRTRGAEQNARPVLPASLRRAAPGRAAFLRSLQLPDLPSGALQDFLARPVRHALQELSKKSLAVVSVSSVTLANIQSWLGPSADPPAALVLQLRPHPLVAHPASATRDIPGLIWGLATRAKRASSKTWLAPAPARRATRKRPRRQEACNPLIASAMPDSLAQTAALVMSVHRARLRTLQAAHHARLVLLVVRHQPAAAAQPRACVGLVPRALTVAHVQSVSQASTRTPLGHLVAHVAL